MREDLLKKLNAEISTLERELKVDLPRQLAEAAAHGDLSENAEHEAAKERKDTVTGMLLKMYERRQGISNMNTAQISTDSVGFWSTVEVLDLDNDEEITYQLVSPDESDPKQGKISMTSPIGHALAGCVDGDEITVVTPRGERNYEVISFTTIHESDKAS
ncbi:MAG: transcription elongation factor GreA [Acidobacteria bacterium]|nr:transcription elongation factor GreA [Acidobacteriota bacterium]